MLMCESLTSLKNTLQVLLHFKIVLKGTASVIWLFYHVPGLHEWNYTGDNNLTDLWEDKVRQKLLEQVEIGQ